MKSFRANASVNSCPQLFRNCIAYLFTSPKKRHKTKGFTLIELLAVIVILTILFTLIMTLIRDALRDARRNQAYSEAYEIHNAIEAFFHEYGRLPLPNQEDHGTSTGWYEDEDELTAIYFILNAREEESGIPENERQNPKQIVFLRREAREASDEPPLRDPWGNPYIVAMDSTYNGIIELESGNVRAHTSAIVRSLGPNGRKDSPANVIISDDIFTALEQ